MNFDFEIFLYPIFHSIPGYSPEWWFHQSVVLSEDGSVSSGPGSSRLVLEENKNVDKTSKSS